MTITPVPALATMTVAQKPFRYGGRRGLREQLESTHLVGGQRVHYSRVGGQLQRVDRDNNWKVQLDIRWRHFLAEAQRAAQTAGYQ